MNVTIEVNNNCMQQKLLIKYIQKIKEELNILNTKAINLIQQEYINDAQVMFDIEEDIDNYHQFNEQEYQSYINQAKQKYCYDNYSFITKNNINEILSHLRLNEIINQAQFETLCAMLVTNYLQAVKEIINIVEETIYLEAFQQYLATINEQRKKFLDDLINKMQYIKQITKNLKAFKSVFGNFWDLSHGQLHRLDINLIKKLERIINKHNFVNKIADLLGQLASCQKSYEEKLITQMEIVPSANKKYYAPQNITSIKYGNELSSLLKYQLALKNNPKYKKIFDLNYVEKKLIMLDQQAKLFEEIEIQKMSKVKTKDQKGPFIICVDTSGSMYGYCEQVAKAFSLALFRIAKREKRKCYVISFSTRVIEFDATDTNKDFNKFCKFLEMSFNGGTDISLALEHAINKCMENDYKNADVIVISDLIVNALEENVLEKIYELQSKKVRFNALTIGNNAIENNVHYFDHNWIYDGTLESVERIVHDLNKLSYKSN